VDEVARTFFVLLSNFQTEVVQTHLTF